MVPLTLARQNGTFPRPTWAFPLLDMHFSLPHQESVKLSYHSMYFWKRKSLQCSLNGLARAATTRSPIGMTYRETREPWPAWENCGVVLVNLRPPANLMNVFLIMYLLYHLDILITLASSQVLILPQKWLLQGSQCSGTTASWDTKNIKKPWLHPSGDFVPLLL